MTMPWKNTPIRRKLMMALLLTGGAVLLPTCAAFITYEVITLRKAMMEGYQTRAEIIAANSAAALAFQDPADATRILGAFQTDPRVTGACLYDGNGKLFAEYPANALPGFFPAAPGASGYRGGHLDVFRPVVQGGRTLGTVYLQSDLSALTDRYRAYAWLAAAIITVSLLLVYLLSSLLQKQISLPILALAETARSVAHRRDFSLRAQKFGDDELGLLTDAFNRMLAEILAQDRALKASEANYREIFEKANEAIFVHEIETGRVLEVNQRAVDMTGYSREELTSAHPADISSGNPGFTREEAGLRMKRALSEGPQVFEWQGRHKDGGIHWIEVSLSRAVIGGKERLLAFFRDIGDRKRAEELARLGQAHAIENIKDYGILMLDVQGGILTWNKGAERMKGYQAAEIVGRNFSVFYTPEDRAKGRPQELLEAARREGRVEEEGWRVRKDGSRFLVDVIITALRNEKGELRGFIKVSRDVTEVKKAQKELQEKTELLDSILKNMGDGVVVADEKGNFIVFNPAAQRIAGKGPVAGGAGQWSEKYGVFRPDGVTPCPPEENPLAKAIRGLDTDDVEQFLRNPANPEGIFVSVTGRPLRDGKGEIRGGVVIVRNITGRKKAEAEVRQTNEFLNAVLENIPNMIFVKDAQELRFVRFNRAGEELLGIPRGELIGKNDYDFFPKADADFYIAKDRKTLEGGKLLDIPVETIQTRHQGPRTLHTKKFPVLGPDGKPQYLMGISEDITEFKRQEQLTIYTKALEVSNKELQDFVFVVSHDLQEPLRKIQSFGNFLKEEAGSALNETAADYLARMQDASQRMGRLIEDLLQLTRITSRAKPFEPVELDQVLREVGSDLEIRLQETGGKVVAKKLPRISADPAQMHQLFQNLIVNALKFRRAETAPVIEVEAEADEVKNLCHIRVKDNGIGFDPKYSEKIFNIFQRLNGSEYEGTGIGLAICRKVVERHKGAIRAASQLGEGATFEITLPLRQS